MKKTLSLTVLLCAAFGANPHASAVTIYTQNWGSPSTAVQTANSLGLVGWAAVANRQGGVGPYYGAFGAAGANDPTLGLGLPVNTAYLTGMAGTNQLGGPGMLYTVTESNVFSVGTNVFISINPSLYTNLTFNVEVRNDGGGNPNYLAVRVGGSWYVATNNPAPPVNPGAYPAFTNWTTVYDTNAAVWNNLTIGTTFVTIGSPAAGNLSGNITGIGIVEQTNTPPGGGNNGYTYNQIVINQGPGDFPSVPPTVTAPAVTPQTVYVGGGASFLTAWAGSPTLAFRWQTNGINLNNGGRIFGATSDTLTITNVNTGDAGPIFSVFATNFFGRATNDGNTLVVNAVPADYLYAETFPYVGPNGNIPITGVGWQGAFQGNTALYSSGPGIGNVFSYSGVATTNIYFTTTTNDIGTSGLRFVTINPDAYPNVTFQANFTPGNGAALNPTNVVAYWAVQMTNGNWYSTVKRIPVQTISQNNYQQYQAAFKRAATNWNTLTINSNINASIGSVAGSDLAGNIVGAGVVIAHQGLAGGGDFNFNTFVLTTNEATEVPPSIDVSGAPWSQTVASGGGVSFGVSPTGSEPFTYAWTLNGVPLVDGGLGGRVSGASTPTITIANLTTNDTGNAVDTVPIVALVTNAAGNASSAGATTTTLTVTNPSVGLLYEESFPFVGPLGGPGVNYPISGAGWVEAVPGVPDALYQNLGSDAAVFAYIGSPATTVYYATTASDTNQAGLRFPNINLGFYTNLVLSVDIAPQSSASNVTAFLAVELRQGNATNWYVAATALPVPTTTDSSTFSPYNTTFNPAAANWNNLTVTASGGIIGSTASGNLNGTMIGAGLVFVTINTGGTFNFDNFLITGNGVGGINQGPLTAGTVNLSWIGNPAVILQGTTNLSSPNWQNVPGTFGVYSQLVTNTGPSKFFRLQGP